MYERILSKEPPSQQEIDKTLGGAKQLLERLESLLAANYDYHPSKSHDLPGTPILSRELKFPFGAAYGWGYKYSHKQTHLCYAFFEAGAVTVTLQLGDKAVPAVEALLPRLLPKTQELWAGRYPCGKQGGWVHYRILEPCELNDVIELIKIKKRPKRL